MKLMTLGIQWDSRLPEVRMSVVKDVFVPEYRTHKQSDGFNLTNPGYEVNKNDLFKIPWGQLFVRAVSTPAIGATKRMLELFIEGANNKASSDPAKLAGDTYTQTPCCRRTC